MRRILFVFAVLCALGVIAAPQERVTKANTLGDTLPLVKAIAAAQAPTISVTFSCSPSGSACTEFLRLVSDGLGYQTGSRMAFVQAQTLKRLYQIAKEQKRQEDVKAASVAAESTFNSAYPEP